MGGRPQQFSVADLGEGIITKDKAPAVCANSPLCAVEKARASIELSDERGRDNLWATTGFGSLI